MAFQLQAVTVIESASLDLTAADLEKLASAAPHLQEVCEFYVVHNIGNESGDVTARPEAVVALDPVMALLSSVATLVDQTGTIKPKRVVRRKPAKRAAK